MKNKDVENRIYSSLESGETLSPGVLDSAKSEMKSRKAPARKPVLKFALAPIFLVIVVLFVVLPVMLTNSKDKLSTYNYSSMKQFFEENGIQLKTLDSTDGDINQNPIESETINSAGIQSTLFVRGRCLVINDGNETVAVKEEYFFKNNNDSITISVLLVADDKVKYKYFSEYDNLFKTAVRKNVEIFYSYDEERNLWRGELNFNGYTIYISGCVSNEDMFLFYCNLWIQKQN